MVLRVGILEAQEEKQIPDNKKYADKAILCFWGVENIFRKITNLTSHESSVSGKNF